MQQTQTLLIVGLTFEPCWKFQPSASKMSNVWVSISLQVFEW